MEFRELCSLILTRALALVDVIAEIGRRDGESVVAAARVASHCVVTEAPLGSRLTVILSDTLIDVCTRYAITIVSSRTSAAASK